MGTGILHLQNSAPFLVEIILRNIFKIKTGAREAGHPFFNTGYQRESMIRKNN